MSNENQDIIAEFAVESLDHLSNIETELLAIEAGGADIDVELVNKVFRAVHSIKGASGFLGLVTIGELAHSMESLLNLLRSRELAPNAAIIEVLLKAADALRGLITNIDESNGVDIHEHVEALQRVIAHNGSPEVQEQGFDLVEFTSPNGAVLRTAQMMLESQRKLGHCLYIIEFDLVADADDKGRTPLDLIRELLIYAEVIEASMPHEQCGGLEDAPPSRLRYTVLVGSVLDEAAMLSTALEIEANQVTVAQPTSAAAAPAAEIAAEPVAPVPQAVAPVPTAPAPRPMPVPATPPPQVHAPAADRGKESAAGPAKANAEGPADTSIRVSVNLLDHLMNLAGELVLSRNQLLQMIATENPAGLDSVGARLNQVTSELQEAIMQTRMQPIGSVFSKFPRVVRDLCNKLNKQCDLVIEGKKVELDKSLLEIITDPLMHMVRNSVDHGIERPEEREAKGKPAMGVVTLRAFHQAGKVNITISDDGHGIDPAVIRCKAVEKGVVAAGHERDLSDRDALNLIFHPGFSTAEKVTDVSGRGVGMDVVKTNIEKAGGTVEIESQPGRGTSIHVRLPLTLAIIPSLIVRCRAERFAIPQVNISELVRINAADAGKRIERIKGAEVLRLRGTLLPLVRLQQVMPAVGDEGTTAPAPGAMNIIVVEAGHLRYGLIVDGLQDSEEIVVKPLGSHLKGVPCLAGATILGDGKVALILDVTAIASHCKLAMPKESKADAATHATAQDGHEMQTMLLFTNDPSEQFGIPMGLISRIERIRVSQIDSIGGQEVLQYRGSSLPLLLLERHVKARPRPVDKESVYVVVFRMGHQELGLVAPTLVDIREVAASQVEQAFREPGVLGSVVLENHATRILDLIELVRVAKFDWLEEEKPTEAARKGRRVLLAEDSDFFRKQVTSFLEAEGYEVVASEDGEAAWEALQSADPPIDVLVTDIEMPRLDGYGLARRVKADPRYTKLPVIAVTSLAGEEDMKRGYAAGVDDYQVKLDREQLAESLSHMVGAGLCASHAMQQAGR